jgi:hypothetical protein
VTPDRFDDLVTDRVDGIERGHRLLENHRNQTAAQAAQAGRKLIGIDAWNAIVGNSITGKNDDGDDLTEFYTKDGKLRQLADDDVTEGTWVLKGQQVCLTYGDDDDDDAECYRIEVQGDIATYIGSEGKGKRYTIVKGNPKKL